MGGGVKSANNSPQAYGEQDCEFVSTWTPLVKVWSDPVGHQAPPSRGRGLVQVLCLQKEYTVSRLMLSLIMLSFG
jgi:hypothetical protein